jgi:(2R)-sulfolactate sulfo-lyase subunit alpha
VHDKVENVQPGQDLSGWVMETDETISVKAMDAIPLGHKIALADIKEGDTLIKYSHDIGRSIAKIGKGHHVHVHNAKTKRW